MRYCKIVSDDSLCHYGVKGMKWRKRKKRLLNEYTQDQIKSIKVGSNMKYCQIVLDNELYHYGVKGMKWGVRKDRFAPGQRMVADRTDSAATKKVKSDYNNLSDKDFFKKYSASKNTYRKRVNKYGDPTQARARRAQKIKVGAAIGAVIVAGVGSMVAISKLSGNRYTTKGRLTTLEMMMPMMNIDDRLKAATAVTEADILYNMQKINAAKVSALRKK